MVGLGYSYVVIILFIDLIDDILERWCLFVGERCCFKDYGYGSEWRYLRDYGYCYYCEYCYDYCYDYFCDYRYGCLCEYIWVSVELLWCFWEYMFFGSLNWDLSEMMRILYFCEWVGIGLFGSFVLGFILFKSMFVKSVMELSDFEGGNVLKIIRLIVVLFCKNIMWFCGNIYNLVCWRSGSVVLVLFVFVLFLMIICKKSSNILYGYLMLRVVKGIEGMVDLNGVVNVEV